MRVIGLLLEEKEDSCGLVQLLWEFSIRTRFFSLLPYRFCGLLLI